ncbi:MAG: TIGR02281 family clan AA aspartic protease [Roseiarcus sp.]|jgi:aspartyl protease family protein
MDVILPLALLAAALIALLVVPADSPLIGLDHASFAGAALGVALMTWLFLSGARRAGPGALARVVGGAAIWTAIILGLTGVYAYRFEVSDIADRVMAELFPNEPQIGQSGEVIVNRRLGGEFIVPAQVDGARVAFLFDTGASTVVLRAQDAKRIGVDAAGLDFDVSVVTANGAATAAEIRIGEIAIGPIVVRNVRALVVRPGALGESLLGMSFLERLQSYTVERGRLILKAK